MYSQANYFLKRCSISGMFEWFKKHQVVGFILLLIVIYSGVFILGQLVPTLGETMDGLISIATGLAVVGAIVFVFLGKHF